MCSRHRHELHVELILASRSVGWTTIDLVQRIAVLLLAVTAIASGVAHAGRNATGSGPLLGITGNVARFQGQTGQASTVDQAFLGWEQGRSYGSSFAVLFQTLAPIPMIHLGTKGRERARGDHARRHRRPARATAI